MLQKGLFLAILVITMSFAAPGASAPGDVAALGATVAPGGGVVFRVWAPNAKNVSVEGDFTGSPAAMTNVGGGIWQATVPGAAAGNTYKYRITGFFNNSLFKMDPYARKAQHSAGWCYVYDPAAYAWNDAGFTAPSPDRWVIYEMHVGTFSGRNDGVANSPATFWDALAKVPYLVELGVNAVEVLPVGEFQGERSWGYNPSLPFTPESTYGGPDGFKAFVDACHQAGIAVVLDVVHNHYGPWDLDLWQYDGWYDTSSPAEYRGGVYFYNDWRADTPWGDTRPDYSRAEVRRFILDNTRYWLEEFHVDGLRWDATLYIRQKDGTDLMDGWNLLKEINTTVDTEHPAVFMIAEDLQNYPEITAPVTSNPPWSMGFDSQWHAMFVHTLRAAVKPSDDNARSMTSVRNAILPAYQNTATHQVIYTESHDEDANGKQRVPSEIDSADPDSYWARKRSTLGASVMFTACGVPMLFMGQEFLMDGWWADTDGSGGSYDGRINWAYRSAYAGIFTMYQDMIRLRKAHPGLRASSINAFRVDDAGKVLCWHRWNVGGGADDAVVIANFRNESRSAYRVGLPFGGRWVCVFHGDSRRYSADFQDAEGHYVTADAQPQDGLNYSAGFVMSPYSVQVYVPESAWKPYLPYGDMNADGVVNAQDMVLLAGWYAANGGNTPDAHWMDLNEDGLSDLADLPVLALYLAAVIPGLPLRP